MIVSCSPSRGAADSVVDVVVTNVVVVVVVVSFCPCV